MERIDINNFLFGRTNPTKKLEVIKAMSDNDIRKTSDATILRIYKECRGKDSDGKPNDRFWIKSDRRAGNCLGDSRFWNSTIEYIYEYNGKAYISFYVQNTKTDWGENVSYERFKANTEFRGYCEYLDTNFRYDSTDIANVIRCILKEFVYYKYIEKDERERAERIRKTLYEVGRYDKVCNEFYTDWRCRYEDCFDRPRTDRYYRAKKAVEAYFTEHIDELYGKPADELQTLIRKIFRETN